MVYLYLYTRPGDWQPTLNGYNSRSTNGRKLRIKCPRGGRIAPESGSGDGKMQYALQELICVAIQRSNAVTDVVVPNLHHNRIPFDDLGLLDHY